jgi:hypothetical protein
MANLELLDICVAHNVLQLVSRKRPNSIGVFRAMLGNDFAVKFVKFDKVRPPQNKVLKELGSLYAVPLVWTTEIADWHRTTPKTIAVIFSGD